MDQGIIPKKEYLSLGQNKAIKELTFANTTGTVTLFTVTGDVRVTVLAICKTNIASVGAGNIRLGVVGVTEGMIADTVGTAIDANEIWNDTSPDSIIEAATTLTYDISNGANIVLTLSAQIDSGAITFYCYSTPHSSTGTVSVA